MKLLRMKPGHGEIVLAEGDVEVAEEEQALIEAFRRELDAGMWAAVPTETRDGRREAELVKSFAEVPRDAERVIFFPRAAGGALVAREVGRCCSGWRPRRSDWARTYGSSAGRRSWRRSGGCVAARERRALFVADSIGGRGGAREPTTTRAASVAPSSARARCCAPA